MSTGIVVTRKLNNKEVRLLLHAIKLWTKVPSRSNTPTMEVSNGLTIVSHGDPLQDQMNESSKLCPNDEDDNDCVEPEHTSTSPKICATQEWNKAFAMLLRNPRLLTPDILMSALRRQAPVQLISYMLQLKPSIASVPKQGPTPLLVALQNSCSIEVVAELIQACPLALVANTPGSIMDPLRYTKMFRSEETDLIQLLTRHSQLWMNNDPEVPMNISDSSKETVATSNTVSKPFFRKTNARSIFRELTEYRSPVCSIKTSEQKLSTRTTGRQVSPETNQAFDPASILSTYYCGSDTSLASVTVAPQLMRPVDTNTEDPNELKNLKLICMAVLKGHRRLSNNIEEVQRTVDELVATEGKISLPTIALLIKLHGNLILHQVKENQKNFAQRQMLALQQNEQNVKDYLQQTEHRLIRSMSRRQVEADGQMEVQLDAVVQGLQSRLSKFSNRIALLEQASPQQVHAPDEPPVHSVSNLTIPKVSFEAIHPAHFNAKNVSYDTTCGETEEDTSSPFTILYACGKKLHRRTIADEKRSLLEGMAMNRSDGKSPHSYCSIPQRRWFRRIRNKSSTTL